MSDAKTTDAERQDSMKAIQDFLVKLDSSIAVLKSDTTTIKGDLTQTKADLAGMKSDLAEARSDLKDVKEDLTGHKGDIRDVKDDVREIRRKIESLKTPSAPTDSGVCDDDNHDAADAAADITKEQALKYIRCVNGHVRTANDRIGRAQDEVTSDEARRLLQTQSRGLDAARTYVTDQLRLVQNGAPPRDGADAVFGRASADLTGAAQYIGSLASRFPKDRTLLTDLSTGVQTERDAFQTPISCDAVA